MIDAIDALADPISLSDPIYSDGEDTITMQDSLVDGGITPEKLTNNMVLSDAIDLLEPRERQILSLRYFSGKTQMEVSDSIGISQAQVSRLEKNALNHIKDYFER
ncbi:MAG: sigma-70 family RNA polymerase sigma factor [Clostridia bacterium]|nr:sigma-70 family RNA polymerase sigma factor [Clostridia bacterium]